MGSFKCRISFILSLSVSLQGGIGKAGVPGEVGLQGLPVSMTSDPKLTDSDWMHLTGAV